MKLKSQHCHGHWTGPGQSLQQFPIKMLGTRAFWVTIHIIYKQWMKLCCTEQCLIPDLIMHRIFIKYMQLMNRKLHKSFKITRSKTNSKKIPHHSVRRKLKTVCMHHHQLTLNHFYLTKVLLQSIYFCNNELKIFNLIYEFMVQAF